MDIILALLPWKLIWSLQMKRTEKLGVCFAMSMGLLYVLVLKIGWTIANNVIALVPQHL
jgi:hypothetical protein